MKISPTKKQNRSKSPHEKVMLLKGFDDNITKHLNCLGSGYLKVSSHGASIAIQCGDLCPQKLDDSSSLWWPELGVRVEASEIEACYAVRSFDDNHGLIECDFKQLSEGFSLGYLASDFRSDLFELITEAHMEKQLNSTVLSNRRYTSKPKFDSCECCASRAERIKSDTEGHPLTKILSTYVKTDSELRFHLATGYTDLVCAWHIDDVNVFSAGKITCIGDKHILHFDVSMIHTIQVMNKEIEAVSYSTMKCYNSLGGVIIEISLEGKQNALKWHKVLLSRGSDYNTVSRLS